MPMPSWRAPVARDRSRRTIGSSSGAPSTARTLLDFLKVVEPKLHYEVLSATDWRPFAHEVWHYLRGLRRVVMPSGRARPVDRTEPVLAARETRARIALEP